MYHRSVGLVEDGVVDIACLEEQLAGSIDDRFIRQDIGHITRRYLPDAWSDVIVLADIAARSECQLRDAQLVLSIDLSEKAAERRLEFNLRNQALGIDLDRTAAR